MTPTAHHPKAPEPVILASLPDGSRARLVQVEGGAALRARLVAMGLRPGAEVHVVHNGGRGPFVMAMDDCRIVIGRGMAHRIRVEPLEPAASGARRRR